MRCRPYLRHSLRISARVVIEPSLGPVLGAQHAVNYMNAALKVAQAEYEAAKAVTPQFVPPTFEDFLAREVVGTPEECLARIAEVESWGVNYIRAMIPSPESQDAIAELLLPRLEETKQPAASR